MAFGTFGKAFAAVVGSALAASSAPGAVFALHRLPFLGLLGWLLVGEARAFRVVIDAGHGGHDRGAQSGLVYEKHLALDVARRLEAYLKKRGVSTMLTRSSDAFLSLGKRVAMGNRHRDAVFVSIHFNSARNRAATGIETFYHTPRSEFLAHLVHHNVIHKTRTKNRGVKRRGFYVIKRARNPAILVEGGFLSNGRERRRCVSRTHRQKLAEAIGYALLRYQKAR